MIDRTFYLSEIIAFYRKKKGELVLVLAVCSLISFLVVLLTSEPHFLAEATFRQIPSQLNGKQSLQSVFDAVWQKGDEAYAISVMQSKTLLGKVIGEMGWQVQKKEKHSAWTVILRELGFSKREELFSFRQVSFDKEITKVFFVRPMAEDTFEVLDEKKKKVTAGKLHEPIHLAYTSWTLESMPKTKRAVCFAIVPKRAVLPALQKDFKIKKSRQDSSLLELKLKAPSRELAIGTLNAIMIQFQDHIKQEHELLAKQQISYLKQKRDDLEKDFDQTLTEHMTYLQTTLGTEGFLGLAEGWEVLSEPKEKYTAQKHNIDLDLKKWKTPDPLEASASHPWKEGMQQREQLDWKISQIEPNQLPIEDLSQIDLGTAQKLHNHYGQECDRIAFQKQQIKQFQERLEDRDFDVALLSEVIQDPVSHAIIQQAAELSLKESDRKNYTEKERERFRKAVSSQKEFLHQHLDKKLSLLQLQSEQIALKISCLEQHALDLLRKEKGNIEMKLAEIGGKMSILPEKWRLESQLKLKKELTLQILEGLTKLSESKVIDHHLFNIESKPLDLADAPLKLQPPHLLLFASLGGISGTCLFALALLAYALYKGFPVSEEFLRDRKFQVASKGQALQRTALETKPGEVVAMIGCDWAKEFAKILKREGKEASIIECPHSASTFEALSALDACNRFILQLNEEKGENILPYEGKNGICVLKK